MSKAESKTAKPARGKKSAEYIEHTDVIDENKTGPKASVAEDAIVVEEVTPEKQISMEIAKFNLPEAAVAKWKEDYGSLSIAGPDDKDGYKAVKAAWTHIRSVRTSLEKKGKELRATYNLITKAIGSEEDRLIDLVTPLEEELQKKWKKIDDDKTAEQERLKKEEEDRLITRIQELMDLGMTFTGGFYVIGETISFDVATIRSAPADQYDKMKAVVGSKKKEIDAKAEEARLEQQRKDDDFKKQQDDLKRQQEAVEKERKEMLQQRREIRVGKLEGLGMQLTGGEGAEVLYWQTVRIYLAPLLDMSADEFAKVLETTAGQIKTIKDADAKREEAEKIRTERIEMVKGIGMKVTGGNFTYDNGFSTVTHGIDSLITLDEYGFQEHFKILADSIKQADASKVQHDKEVAEEKLALEKKEKFIAAAMDTAGMAYNYNLKRFEFKNEVAEYILTWNELLPMSEADITLKAQEISGQIITAKNKAIEDDKKRKADAKKLEEAGLKDKDRYSGKITEIEAIVLSIVPGEFKTDKYKKRSQAFLERISTLLNEFK